MSYKDLDMAITGQQTWKEYRDRLESIDRMRRFIFGHCAAIAYQQIENEILNGNGRPESLGLIVIDD